MEEKIQKEKGKEGRADVLEIDLSYYGNKLWAGRKFLLKATLIGAVIGLVIAFSIPKSYKVTALLSPESTHTGNTQMENMAAVLGFGRMSQQNVDALNIGKTEDIVKSTQFIIDLMDVRVKTIDGKVDTTIIDYIGMQKAPWWNTVLSAPLKGVGMLMSMFKQQPATAKVDTINPFQLTREQARKVTALRKSIQAKINKERRMIEISTTFQDPMVAALMTDSVMATLQRFITQYKTNKAQQNCDYLENIYKEKQKEYYEAQERYARYTDANQNVIRRSASTERIRLQNEMDLAFQIYSQVATQLQLTRVKVQEEKPAFAILEPATVPLKASAPNKKLILVVFMFVAFMGASLWILFVRDCYHAIQHKRHSAAQHTA